MHLVLDGFEDRPYKPAHKIQLFGVYQIHKSKGERKMKPLEAKETQKTGAERVRNSPSLRTRVIESKKKYNRKREKARDRRSMET